jgi:hypothetical protein
METAFFEEWKDIAGFEGVYQVSTLGRVRSCDRYLRACHGGRQFKKGQIISPKRMRNGYFTVGLSYNGRVKRMYIHRLVATVFLSNPNSYPEINHRDEDKGNNRFDNLEWCSHRYNINYGTTAKRISISHLNGGYGKKPVAQLKDGVEVARYDSAADASRATGIDASAIRKVCLSKEKHNTAGGFRWVSV